MINKKLLSFDRGALRYVGANVAFQWLGMLCNVIFVRTIARLVGAAFAGSLTSAQLWQNLVLCLATVPMRFAFTMLASAMSDQASKDVKRTLRSSIYAKLARLGPNYTETAATSEVVMLASEGVEQIDTYFAKYLPQLLYSLLAPVTLFVLLVGVHARSAIILLCCVPLIPMSIVAVQKFAKKLPSFGRENFTIPNLPFLAAALPLLSADICFLCWKRQNLLLGKTALQESAFLPDRMPSTKRS